MKYLGIYFDSRLIFDKHIGNIAEKSTKLIYIIGKSAKLQWGVGHKSLKIVYEGTLIPLLTYGAPVWEEAVAKQKKKPPQAAKSTEVINIKIAKAHRTISFEASCLVTGVPPIGNAIEEKACLYKRKHRTG